MSDGATLDRLRDAAFDAMRNAYAPYSGFRVGAALLGGSGDPFVGCNVENACYAEGLCAERAAVLAAVAHGERELTHVVIASEAEEPTPPCGACRQVLAEFNPAIEITSCTVGGAEARWTLAELLPHPFTPHSLERL